jgi:hypothetical protein
MGPSWSRAEIRDAQTAVLRENLLADGASVGASLSDLTRKAWTKSRRLRAQDLIDPLARLVLRRSNPDVIPLGERGDEGTDAMGLPAGGGLNLG